MHVLGAEAVNSMLKLESDAFAGRVCVLSVQVKDQFNTNFKVSIHF